MAWSTKKYLSRIWPYFLRRKVGILCQDLAWSNVLTTQFELFFCLERWLLIFMDFLMAVPVNLNCFLFGNLILFAWYHSHNNKHWERRSNQQKQKNTWEAKWKTRGLSPIIRSCSAWCFFTVSNKNVIFSLKP